MGLRGISAIQRTVTTTTATSPHRTAATTPATAASTPPALRARSAALLDDVGAVAAPVPVAAPDAVPLELPDAEAAVPAAVGVGVAEPVRWAPLAAFVGEDMGNWVA